MKENQFNNSPKWMREIDVVKKIENDEKINKIETNFPCGVLKWFVSRVQFFFIRDKKI